MIVIINVKPGDRTKIIHPNNIKHQDTLLVVGGTIRVSAEARQKHY